MAGFEVLPFPPTSDSGFAPLQVFSYTDFVCACTFSLFKPFFSLHLDSFMSYASLCTVCSILIRYLFVFTLRNSKKLCMFSFFALWFLCSWERMWPNSNKVFERKIGQTLLKVSLWVAEIWLLQVKKTRHMVWTPPWHWEWRAAQALLLSPTETFMFTRLTAELFSVEPSWSKGSPSRVWPSLCSKNLKDEFFLMDTQYNLVVMISSNNDMSAVHDSQLWHFKKELYWGVIDTLVNCLN